MQSRTMSFIESVTNVVVGFGLAVLTQVLVFPLFGIVVSRDQHVSIALIFTLVCWRGFTCCGGYSSASVNEM